MRSPGNAVARCAGVCVNDCPVAKRRPTEGRCENRADAALPCSIHGQGSPPTPSNRPPHAPPLPAKIGKYRVTGATRRRGDQRGVPRPRRLPEPRRRDQAGARRGPRRLDRGPSLGALLRRRGGARRAPPAPQRGADLRCGGRPGRAVPGDGVRAPAARCAVLPLRPAAAARADRRDRLQVRDGARLRVSPGPDPSRRQAGQPAGHVRRQRHDPRRQDQRFRQRAEPRLGRHPDPPRRLARLHVARAARRRHARLPGRHVFARRGAVPPDRRPAAVRRPGAVGHDAPDLHGSSRRR